ncbi:MAG: orotidine-5'-phosphate decarboxylase [Dehalococcoidia bacterium]|nr:orotidine-5'-phosphate decarboxylase [Dehalococcoidia bacterium]RLC65325.1 MAG: orotidine-5'-phosphate decarboxylase [Chloroflexota bacterium]
MKFSDKLLNASRKNKSWLCIGLDPDPELMPGVDVLQFNKAIIESTCDLVCAYKPNLAFYEAIGTEGPAILEKTIKYIPGDIPVIGDAKRGDIGNTARAYARALFSVLNFDAATVNPYLGFDSIEPFINYQDKGVFILCRTSNQGATDFQNLCTNGTLLYEAVAQKAKEWNTYDNIGLVVGATYPEELKKVRSICPEMLLLIPGIGAQGGDLASAVGYGVDARGEKAIINVSRQILYASKERDFAQAARSVAEKIRNQINDYLKAK